MDRVKEEQYANQFVGENECYVKGEMRDGILELVVGGHQLAILHTAMCMMQRVSELSGQPWESAMEAVNELHNMVEQDNVVPFRGKH